PLVGERFDLVGAAGAGRLEDRPAVEVEEVADLEVSVGMGPAHEAVADHADVEGFRHGRILGAAWSALKLTCRLTDVIYSISSHSSPERRLTMRPIALRNTSPSLRPLVG